MGRHPRSRGRTFPRLFSPPGPFFPLLMTGKLTLLEVYFLTLPGLSWMQILIGDPLYHPFKTPMLN